METSCHVGKYARNAVVRYVMRRAPSFSGDTKKSNLGRIRRGSETGPVEMIDPHWGTLRSDKKPLDFPHFFFFPRTSPLRPYLSESVPLSPPNFKQTVNATKSPATKSMVPILQPSHPKNNAFQAAHDMQRQSKKFSLRSAIHDTRPKICSNARSCMG